MTRGVVCHWDLDGSWRRSHFHRGELLAHVTHSGAEVCCGAGEFVLVVKEMNVGREHCTAAPRVCDDRRIGFESSDVLAGEFARAFEISRVCMECAATHLFRWCRDLEVVSS